MIVEAVVTQKLVQEQFDFPVLQAFHMNLVSLGRNAALNALDMFSEKVYSRASLLRQSREVYCLLLLFLFSNRF
jgi:hypothetical protein